MSNSCLEFPTPDCLAALCNISSFTCTESEGRRRWYGRRPPWFREEGPRAASSGGRADAGGQLLAQLHTTLEFLLLDMESGDVEKPPPVREGVVAAPIEGRACLTDQRIVKMSFLWTVTNFSLCRQNTAEALLSSTFAAGERKNVAWRLKLYPRGGSESCRDFLSLFLVSCNGRRVCAKATFSIVDTRKEEVNTKQTRTRLFSRRGDGWGFAKFISRASLKLDADGLLPADTLTLKCELNALESSTVVAGPVNGAVAIPECHLSEDLGWLLDSSYNSDVTLRVDGRTFAAHRSILAARSPVFRAMFAHPMQEQALGEVVVQDVEHDVFAALLRFMYTGRVPDSIEKPRPLFVAADKYQLERLKAACEVALLSGLTVGSAADTLLLADSHSARELRRGALEFVCAHIGHVMETTGWKAIRERRTDLVEEALLTLASQHAEPPAKRSRDSLKVL
ncbi:hypothetical protein V5799_005437 [Amblyomma americanum]|uniref:Uncharacterized protein n=1 Tax=Amblyomma americanum TaxID=6943 RepID=A0AAQ4DZ88_AMBAM